MNCLTHCIAKLLKSQLMTKFWLLAVLLLSFPISVQAQNKLEVANKHFHAGLDLYSARKWQEAATEFEAAYQVVPLPVYILNEAECYNALHLKNAAIPLLQKYLKIGDDPKGIAIAKMELKKLGVDPEAVSPSPPQPPIPDPGTGPASVGPNPPTPPEKKNDPLQPQLTPPSPDHSDAPANSSNTKWWLIGGGAGVVVAAGVAILALSLGGSNAP